MFTRLQWLVIEHFFPEDVCSFLRTKLILSKFGNAMREETMISVLVSFPSGEPVKLGICSILKI